MIGDDSMIGPAGEATSKTPLARGWVIAAALVLMGAVIAVMRMRSFGEPLERDLTTYALIAEGLSQGRVLYSDLWDHKPPGIHVAFWAAQSLFGMGAIAVYAMGCVMSLITLVGVYFAASAHRLGWKAGLLGAGLWALTQDDIRLGANQPNVEAFLNAIGIWIFVLVSRPPPHWRTGAASGLLLGVAMLFKPIAASWGLIWLGGLWSSRDGLRWDAVRTAAAAASLALAVVVATGAYFVVVGRADAFWDATVVYNRYYAGSILSNIGRGLVPQAIFCRAVIGISPLAVFAVLGLRNRRDRRTGPAYRLLGLYMAGSWLAVCAPGWFYAHYYQLILPPLCVAAAWGIAGVSNFTRARSWAVAIAIVLWSVGGIQLPSHLLSPEQWSNEKYGAIFVQSASLGRWIDNALEEDETFYNWGAETGLYYARGSLPTPGVLYNYPLRDGPLAAELTARLMSSLARTPPDLIVVSDVIASGHPFEGWLDDHYIPIPRSENYPSFALHLRTGSPLHTRFDRGRSTQ